MAKFGIALLSLLGLFGWAFCGNCFSEAENRTLNEHDLSVRIFLANKTEPWERPVASPQDIVELEVFLGFEGINEIDEITQYVRIAGYLGMAWYDPRHKWDHIPELSCMEYLILPPGRATGMWLPDMGMSNADAKFEITRSERDFLRIRKDGFVSYTPGGQIEFRCTFILSFFPFDSQVCAIRLESWRYPTDQEVLVNISVFTDGKNYDANGQWSLVGLYYKSNTVKYTSNKAFSRVYFYMKIKRRTSYFLLCIVLPCILAASVELVTFAAPLDKNIRLEVSFTALLAFSLFQAMVMQQVSRSADHPPLFLVYISLVMIYIALAIFGQALAIYLTSKAKLARPKGEDDKPIDSGCLLATANVMARAVCIDQFQQERYEPDDRSGKVWLFVALVVDRYTFLTFSSLLVATSLGFFGMSAFIEDDMKDNDI